VAGQIGYCGLDPRRATLRGDEIRPCWEAQPVTAPASVAPGPRTDVRRRLDFVPIDEPPSEPVEPAPVAPRPDPGAGYMLWADPE
jgi:hypothetical protein